MLFCSSVLYVNASLKSVWCSTRPTLMYCSLSWKEEIFFHIIIFHYSRCVYARFPGRKKGTNNKNSRERKNEKRRNAKSAAVYAQSVPLFRFFQTTLPTALVYCEYIYIYILFFRRHSSRQNGLQRFYNKIQPEKIFCWFSLDRTIEYNSFEWNNATNGDEAFSPVSSFGCTAPSATTPRFSSLFITLLLSSPSPAAPAARNLHNCRL